LPKKSVEDYRKDIDRLKGSIADLKKQIEILKLHGNSVSMENKRLDEVMDTMAKKDKCIYCAQEEVTKEALKKARLS